VQAVKRRTQSRSIETKTMLRRKLEEVLEELMPLPH
jgi:hypothetical protein